MSLDRLVDELVELSVNERQAMSRLDADTQHRIVGRLVRVLREMLARGAEGRAALTKLLDHPEGYVRLNVAGRVLAFAPELAVPVLEQLHRDALAFAEAVGTAAALTPEIPNLGGDARLTLFRWRMGDWKFE